MGWLSGKSSNAVERFENSLSSEQRDQYAKVNESDAVQQLKDNAGPGIIVYGTDGPDGAW